MCFPGKRLEPGRLGHLPQDVRPSSAFIQLRLLFVVPLGAAAWTIEFILPGPQVGHESDMSIAFRHHLSYVALSHVAVVAQDTPIADAAPSQFEASTPNPFTANTFLLNFFGMDDWAMSLQGRPSRTQACAHSQLDSLIFIMNTALRLATSAASRACLLRCTRHSMLSSLSHYAPNYCGRSPDVSFGLQDPPELWPVWSPLSDGVQENSAKIRA